MNTDKIARQLATLIKRHRQNRMDEVRDGLIRLYDDLAKRNIPQDANYKNDFLKTKDDRPCETGWQLVNDDTKTIICFFTENATDADRRMFEMAKSMYDILTGKGNEEIFDIIRYIESG